MLGIRRTPAPWLVAGAGGVAIAGYLLAPTDSVLQVALWFVPLGLAAALVARRWWTGPPGLRQPLGLLLAGTLGYLGASLVRYLTPVAFDTPLPFPSPADLAFFASYAMYGVFLLLVVRHRQGEDPVESRLAAVDALILTGAATTVVWEAVIEPNLALGATDLASVTALAYPFLTLALVGLGLRVVTSGRTWREGAGLLLVLWIALEVVADLEYSHQGVNGTFAYGGVLSTLWMASYVALGALMVAPGANTLLQGTADRRVSTPSVPASPLTPAGRVGGWARLVALYAAAVLPVVLLGGHESHAVVIVASMTTFGLVVLRMAIVAGDRREQQRLAQELESANAAKSDFLATMSHEIRTPLNAVIGMTGLLLDSPLRAEQRDYAETTRGAGEALLAIINDILDFSKIEAGRLDLEAQPFLLTDCVESAVDLLAPQAAAKGVALAYLVDRECPDAVLGDVTRLRQVLVNLLSNAVKFTDEGEVTLCVVRDAGGGGSLRFSVSDSGPGIPDDRIDRLFEPFRQVDSSTTRTHGGTGLGLAISRRLVLAMGGDITAVSPAGEGATFHVSVPLPEAEVPPRPARRTPDDLPGKHVLVVDDNPTNRRIILYQLHTWGMTAADTDDPEQALAWVREGATYDAGILDLQMPGTDGVALAALLRNERALMPLLLLSSLGERLPGGTAADFAAVLTKPIKPSTLYDALASALDSRPVDTPVEPVAEAPERATSRLRILLAEDNLVNQKVAVRVLERLGYRADVVADGNEAVQAVHQRPYDLVFMDVQMPIMDGLEATRRIRAGAPAGGQPRIVAMTANAFAEDRAACLAAGMDDYLSKPVRREALATTLAAAALVERDGSTTGGRDGR